MVKTPLIFSKILALAAVFLQTVCGAGLLNELAGPQEDTLVFVYVHGFGGAKESPEFCVNLEEFISEEEVPARVVNHEWDSVEVAPLQAGASWLKAQEMADREAPKFRREVLEKLEGEGRSYVLVGFSVGTRVLLKSLEETGSELKGLRGVYFLGSAMSHDLSLKNRKALPAGMKITNYHSPKRDLVHRIAFNFMSEVPSGGQLGFDDEGLFENFSVACAHTHKGIGITTDYSGLAEAIAFLELAEAGVEVEGKTKLNWELRVGKGEWWWNRVAEIDELTLEQHTMRPGYYRAVKVDAAGKRWRIARGENLHAILKEVRDREPVSHRRRRD